MHDGKSIQGMETKQLLSFKKTTKKGFSLVESILIEKGHVV